MPNDNSTNIKEFSKEISILPLRDTVVYPSSLVPLLVGIKRSVQLINDSLEGDSIVGLATMKDSSIQEPGPDQIYKVGTLAKVDRVKRDSENNLHIMVQGLERFRIDKWTGDDPYLKAEITILPDVAEEDMELDALKRSLVELAQEVVNLSPQLPNEVGGFLSQIDDPKHLTYLVASYSNLDVHRAQEILEMDTIKEKLRALISHVTHEKEVLGLGKKIQTEAREKMDKDQRDYFLRQQLRAIKKELGEQGEGESVVDEYSQKLEKARLPEEADKEARRELKRLEGMSPHSQEYSVIRTYLDWVLDIPWNVLSEDQNDIQYARQVLDEDHYDLQEVKERVIEYLSVRKLIKERGIKQANKEENPETGAKGVILCFAGPPGVGKTSLGRSIARSLGRKFTRMSLGGIRDEAEIRGHRRTYIGAMPGRIIQAIKRAGTKNPVFMLDEVDKIGIDWRGDPSSALLEVLDPAQNYAFRDHYLDLDFDLSEVIFIATANQLETIPAPLRDRMEIIQLDGYTEFEKLHIAKKFLIPRQIEANGLLETEISFSEEAVRKIIQDYTKEAGVRDLERQVGAICRKSAVKIVGSEPELIEITPQRVRDFLKKERFESDTSETFDLPGIATGLAVTAFGGDILFIEATAMKGKGQLTLTGQLGDVMRESAQIAHSYVRSKAPQLCIDTAGFEVTDIHVHVPAGAIPKDGPSAGIAMIMAIASLFSGRPVHSDVGMTGEVTLRGRVLPVGGIKTKVLAAHRAGLKKVILPKRNERDLDDVPDEIRNDLEFVMVDRIDEALDVGLLACVQDEKMDIAANS
ncbi:endopeptidase La [Thermodesulfobacteriota bacterium]